ncbi:EamA-like transporter family protein [Candidatus Fokinia solitaria]|uniref:S-adenosylmethionine uptake transporter n=1 Tax=Candidatus Fokinia solitaria TaxID=1802984 RepID=A0A2U8BRJ4_9RICK|nr:DMT family transporter [Candidatus Fokinia solitaria]AWD32961.1 EamA-like transporter family protein [Candidatus Fokinia solitaria]
MLMSTDYRRYIVGVLCKVLALSCFCLLSLGFEKFRNSSIGPLEQFGVVCILGTAILLPFVSLFYRKELQEAKMMPYVLRSVLSIAGMVTWIEAVKHFGSAQAILVNYITPILTVSIASLTKNEKLRWISFIAGILCYAVIFFTLKTHIEVSVYGFVMAVISSFSWAFYEVVCKKQTTTEHFIVQVFYTFAFTALFLLFFSVKKISAFTASDISSLLVISVLRITNVILLFLAIKLATLNFLTPVSYLKLPLMTFWSFVLLGTPPRPYYLLAAGILICINITMLRVIKKLTEQKTQKAH